MDKKEYFLYVKGKAVKVNEEIYRAYWKMTEHEKYLQRKDWKYNVLPFSVFDYDGHYIDNIVDESIDIEKIVEVKMQIEELNKALNSLTEEERDITKNPPLPLSRHIMGKTLHAHNQLTRGK